MLRLPTNKKQTMLNGAITLVITTLIVKVIGVLYKIPLTAMLGEVGLGYFSSAYDVYTPIVSISMAGIPIAVAKMVSQDVALHRYRNARQTFTGYHFACLLSSASSARRSCCCWRIPMPFGSANPPIRFIVFLPFRQLYFSAARCLSIAAIMRA